MTLKCVALKSVRNIKLAKCELGVMQAKCNVTASCSPLIAGKKNSESDITYTDLPNLNMFTQEHIQQTG